MQEASLIVATFTSCNISKQQITLALQPRSAEAARVFKLP